MRNRQYSGGSFDACAEIHDPTAVLYVRAERAALYVREERGGGISMVGVVGCACNSPEALLHSERALNIIRPETSASEKVFAVIVVVVVVVFVVVVALAVTHRPKNSFWKKVYPTNPPMCDQSHNLQYTVQVPIEI